MDYDAESTFSEIDPFNAICNIALNLDFNIRRKRQQKSWTISCNMRP